MASLARAVFRDHYHACAFVVSPEEERAVIEPFFVEGMTRGEKAVYIVDPEKQCHHHARLAASSPAQDLLEVTTWNEAHLKGGTFDQDRMIDTLDQMLREHASSGKPPMRYPGWTATSWPDGCAKSMARPRS